MRKISCQKLLPSNVNYLYITEAKKHTRRKGVESVRTNEDDGPLLFDGSVDIVAAFREDGYNEGWGGLCLPLTLFARGTELL